jgi:hypothetical protein
MDDKIPQDAIDLVAAHINQRASKNYSIPVVGVVGQVDTPQVFEIIPFQEIDNSSHRVYAIDGSYNSQAFYNGVTIATYRAGYVCYCAGKPVRMNSGDDPVILGKSYSPKNILVSCDDHLTAIYEELLGLEPVQKLLEFFGADKDNIFSWNKETVCQTLSKLLSFCQEVLEWALVYEVATRPETKMGDIILRDGALRSLNIKQPFLVKLGIFLSEDKGVLLAGITKNSPVKLELSYTFRQIDSYLQDQLKKTYPFKEKNPQSQKLCSWFEISDAVLANAYGSEASGMYAKKALTGGRGIGLFFAARLDYVEKLQNYDWVMVDVNILDAVPGIERGKLNRDVAKLESIFKDLTRLTQEHYILGYPYPLVEAHNFVTLKSSFNEEIVSRVKHSLYSTQRMDNIDIENLFLDIHSRF